MELNIVQPENEGIVVPEGHPARSAGSNLLSLAKERSLAKYLETLSPMIQLSFDMIVSKDVAAWQIYSQQFS